MRYLCCLSVSLYSLTLVCCKPQPVIDAPAESVVEPSATPIVEPEPAPEPAEPEVVQPGPTPVSAATPDVEAEAEKPAIVLPPPPILSSAGYKLILDFEVGGGKPYYDRYLIRPTWPGASSGVTIAVGYDLGFNSKSVILSDWSELSERHRLTTVAGITGTKAKARVAEVRDILIAWNMAEKVFNDVTLSKFYSQTQRAFPGLERLRPNAQAALVSLVFNRGGSMSGPNRLEMRAIRDFVPKRDYEAMAFELRKMVRVWRGTAVEAGLTRRRMAEANLILNEK